MATARSDVNTPVLFDLKSEGGESWLCDDNYQVIQSTLHLEMSPA